MEPEKTILYRDDGLMAIKATGRQLDKMRQRLEVKFREFNLKIECMIPKTNVVEYLDIKFNFQVLKVLAPGVDWNTLLLQASLSPLRS